MIANGDVIDARSAKLLMSATGAQGVMIARSSLGQPWLFKQIEDQLNQQRFEEPSLLDIGQMLFAHVRGLIELECEYPAMLQSRKLVKYYARAYLTDSMTLTANSLSTYEALRDLVNREFIANPGG